MILNGAEVFSGSSGNLINHRSINWAQYKDPVSHMRLAGAVIACWSITLEFVGLSCFNDKHFLSLNSLNSVKNI